MSDMIGIGGMIRPGTRVHLGHLAGGGFGLWLAAGGHPIATFAPDQPGWDAAVRQWLDWEQPAPSRHLRAIGTLAVLVIIILVYWGLHTFIYRDALVTPGFFSWPATNVTV